MPKKAPVKPPSKGRKAVPKPKPKRYTQAEIDSINASGQQKMMRDRLRRDAVKKLGEREYKNRLT